MSDTLRYIRRLLLRPCIGFVALSLAVSGELLGQVGTYRLGEVLAIRTIEIADGESETFEEAVREQEYPFFDEWIEGIDAAVLVGDRGMEAGKYIYTYIFDTLERRNYYFPTEAGPFPVWEPIAVSLNEHTGEAFEKVTSEVFTGDFLLVGSETAPDLPWVDLLGIHFVKVKPEMEASFELFVREEWNKQAHLPGFWRLFYKADRGTRKGDYIVVYAFENRAVRDALWPDHETLAGTADWIFRAAYPGTLQEYFVPSGVDEYTDWIMVR